jgi:hypothetical protein
VAEEAGEAAALPPLEVHTLVRAGVPHGEAPALRVLPVAVPPLVVAVAVAVQPVGVLVSVPTNRSQ